MGNRKIRVAKSRPLDVLGISEMEERMYRALLGYSMATAKMMAKRLRITQTLATRLLADIESKGLATHTLTVPRNYIPAPPEFMVDALILQRQRMLESARIAIPDLKKQARRASRGRGPEQVLEIIADRARLALVFAQMCKSCRSTVIAFQRAPRLLPLGFDRSFAPGVLVRTISDPGKLRTPTDLSILKEDMAKGEVARTAPTLPFKMVIMDQKIGIITLDSDSPLAATALLIHGSELIDALCLLFELVWEKSTPILSVRRGKVKTGNVDTHQGDLAKNLIPLLAAGLNDKAVANEAGISPATFHRRIHELTQVYGTRTRFQLGWRAALDTEQANSAALAEG